MIVKFGIKLGLAINVTKKFMRYFLKDNELLIKKDTHLPNYLGDPNPFKIKTVWILDNRRQVLYRFNETELGNNDIRYRLDDGKKDNIDNNSEIYKSIEINQDVLKKIDNSVSLDFFNNNHIEYKLDDIYNNIDTFSELITSFKKILFISSDYPGYGGAATNCLELINFYSKTHDTYGVFYLFPTDKNKPEKWSNNNYKIVSLNNLKDTLLAIPFKPDLIILKNFVDIDLRNIFKCPIYYLVAGIYKNNLDINYNRLETRQDHDKYINQKVLEQIKNSDYSFTNSSHTQKVLNDIYGLTTYLFYSSFVPFYKQDRIDDPDFESRQYEYGLVMSNFGRPIKNVEKSIEFLKDDQNVILIGKNSEKYRRDGWTCLDLMERDELMNYYKKIKYLVQDSHYESCSNVMVEGWKNGCCIKNNLNFFQYFNNTYDMTNYLLQKNKNVNYFEFVIYKNIENNLNFIKNIKYGKEEYEIIEEEEYLNRFITKIPIFKKSNKIKYEKENIIYVYKDYLNNKDNFYNYINFLINELENLNLNNKFKKQNFYNFVEKYRSLKKYNRGLIFICFGVGYVNICLDVLTSYRKHTKLPILLYIDSNIYNKEMYEQIDDLTIIVIGENFDYARIIKTQCYKYSPFKETCYVDIDSECLKNFDYVFDKLRTYDLCMQKNLNQVSIEYYIKRSSYLKKDAPVGLNISHAKQYLDYFNKLDASDWPGFNDNIKFDVYAGGLVFFSKNNVTKKIFDKVSYYWNKFDRIMDMISWTIVINTSKINIYNLEIQDFNQINSRIIKSLHWHTAKSTFVTTSKFIKKRYHPLTNYWQDAGFDNIFLKKTILVCYDQDGWVLNEISHILQRYLGHKYIIVIANEKEACKIPDYNYDLLFFLNLNYFICDNFKHVNTNKIICGKTSDNWPNSKRYYNMFKVFKIIHANTRYLCNKVRKYNSGKVFYVPNGIDTQRFYRTREVDFHNKVRVSMISSEFRAKAKGLEHYIKVINYLNDKNIVVEDKKIIVMPSGKIIPNVELIKHYNDIDIFICLSEKETGPQPCFEALACGRIVITTNIGLIQEVIKNDYNGYLINDRNNIEEIGSIIIKYLSYSKDKKQEMSNNCIESVKKYDWKYQVNNYEKMFDYYFSNKI